MLGAEGQTPHAAQVLHKLLLPHFWRSERRVGASGVSDLSSWPLIHAR